LEWNVIHGYETTFPIPLAMAASFDMSLIEHASKIAARESQRRRDMLDLFPDG